jgi:hypothetical protein
MSRPGEPFGCSGAADAVELPADAGDNRGVGAAVLALASSILAGASVGLLAARAAGGAGVRPRRWLREAGHAVAPVASCVAAAASAVAIAGGLRADDSRTTLALTCLAAAALIAFATWLVLVEADDGGSAERPDEPEWWPAFERDLDEWTRGRVPTGGRR